MSYRIGNINSNLIGEFKSLDFSIRKQFSDDQTVERWKSIGHLYVNYGGCIIYHNDVPDWCKNILTIISKQLNICYASCSLYCMPPGTIMPEHEDYYPAYRKIHNIDDIEKVRRVLVFVDEWKSGHYFEINGNPIVNWNVGDYCTWVGKTPHIAANIGNVNRYTLQITGKIND